MIDYELLKTNDTMQALCLMFPKLEKIYLREQVKKFTKESDLITRLNKRNNG